jgi:fructose transport system ATP-binding protein
MTATTAPLVMQAKGLIKRYGQVTALDGADFELRAGEILAVIGDNGAGKSSLIKCLSGATVPDEGQILLDGKPIHFKAPIDARREGIETVYQDLAVAPAMTIAENLVLGREIRREGFLGNVLRNGLTLMGVSSVYQVLINGSHMIVAETVVQLTRKGAL